MQKGLRVNSRMGHFFSVSKRFPSDLKRVTQDFNFKKKPFLTHGNLTQKWFFAIGTEVSLILLSVHVWKRAFNFTVRIFGQEQKSE